MVTKRRRSLSLALSAAALVGGTFGIGGTHAAFAAPAATTTAPTGTAAWSTGVGHARSFTGFQNASNGRHRFIAPTSPVHVAAPIVPTAASVSPSGVSVPRGDLPGWHQVYATDFATPTASFPGTAYAQDWDVYDNGWKDTSGNGTYMPSQVLSVHNGVLDYFIHSVGNTHEVAAPWIKATQGHTYGRYSVRFRADNLPGYKTAWLLWPDSGKWPTDGEIDMPEGNLDRLSTIHAFSHYATSAGGQDAFQSTQTYANWHTVTVEWLPGKVIFILDGKVLGISTHDIPSTAMHWVLQTETNLDGYAPSSAVQGHVLVDWVAFWTRA